MKARSSKYLQSVQSLGNLRPAQLIQFARKTQVYTQNYYSDLSNKRAVHLIIFGKNISTTLSDLSTYQNLHIYWFFRNLPFFWFLRNKNIKKNPTYTGCCYSVPFHSILVFSKIKNCYFLPLLNPSNNKEWKEIAILKLLFPFTFLLILKIAISFYFFRITIPFHFSL